jgi:phosphoribosylformylglycinamidine (FGAM) synthase-like amidotransferase family enzyme
MDQYRMANTSCRLLCWRSHRRHLALMPHPERCYLGWQQPWVPKELGLAPDGPGPWLRLFQNARTWAESHHD